MNGEEPLVKIVGAKITQSEYDYVLNISKEKKWSVSLVLREMLKEQMKPNVKTILSEKIHTLFYQGYFDEFLEDLALNEPELFKEYTNSQEALACL